MPRFTLIRFDRYEVAKSEIIYHNTYETNLGLAFKEVIVRVWENAEGYEFDLSKVKGYGNQLGIDFEEESYLFFES
jgi:hypothetical protein